MGNLQKRYPSIRAFQKQEASLFIGRDQEIKLLYNKVVSEKMVLLFARSGIGKSSLINAGLIPMLEDRGFLPLDIRLTSSDDPTDTPLLIFKKLLVHYLDKEKYDNLITDVHKTFPEYQPGLWEYFKCCTFPLATTPVLIFDQFEQFFSFSVAEQDEFMEEFGNIIADTPPAKCIDWLHDLAGMELREKYAPFLNQPDLHVLFAIRSDKIFEMNRLSQIVSNILRNRFELYPLKEEEAKKAISVPAAAKNSFLYQSHPFTYDPVLIDNIIVRLKGGNDIIEPTQLQIICSEIENRIILGPDGEPDKPEGYVVTETDLRNIGGIENIVSHFYQNQVKKMGDEKYQELARILIEDNLFDKDARNRKLAFKEAVGNILKQGKEKLQIKELDTDQFINKLLGLRLIREDYRENKKFYEISHDYLLNAITESFETREAKRLAEANAELERNYETLRKLKEKAEKAEETARRNQQEAEKATLEARKQQELADDARKKADRNFELAIKERQKVEKLKRRNERLGVIVFLVAFAGLVYLIYQISEVKKNKRKIEVLSKKATKGIISIYSSEAEKRYAAGDQLVAYALWDTARTYNDEDTALQNRLNNLKFSLFSGASIQVSEGLNYIGVKLFNNRFNLWRTNNKTDEIERVIGLPEIKNFLLLPDGKVLLLDTAYKAYSFDPVADKVPAILFSDTTEISSFRLLTGTNLVICEVRGSPEKYFFTADSLKPLPYINTNFRRLAMQPDEISSFMGLEILSVDRDNFLIKTFRNAFYLFNISSKNAPPRIPISPNVSFYNEFDGKKIAYNENKRLKILETYTGDINDTQIPLGEFDSPIQYIKGDSLLLVLQYATEEMDKPTGFCIYSIQRKKKIFQRLKYSDVKVDTDMGIVGFTDTEGGLILFDALKQKVIYPLPTTQDDLSVKTFRMFAKSKKIFLQMEDNSIKILTVTPDGIKSDIVPNGTMPQELYGDTFQKIYDSRARKYLLEYQDSVKNNVLQLRQVLKKYIDKEVEDAVDD